MNHQQFESWIFEQNDLSSEEKNALENHIRQCSTCNDLNNKWQVIDQHLHSLSDLSPAVGFTQRWKTDLAERKQQAQRKNTVKILFILLMVAIILFFSLLFIYYKNTSPIEIVSNLIQMFLQISIRLNIIKQSLIPLFNSLPVFVPLLGWLLLSSGFFLLVISWLLLIWRVSTQGVFLK